MRLTPLQVHAAGGSYSSDFSLFVKNFVAQLMDNDCHAVTVVEGLIDLDFAPKAQSFCAVSDCRVFKLNSKLAACLLRIREQLCTIILHLPRQRRKRLSVCGKNIEHVGNFESRSVPAVRVCCSSFPSGSSCFLGL